MGAVPFDTLKMARNLEATGVERSVAWGIVEGVVAALAEIRLPDTDRLEPALKSAAPADCDRSSRARRDFTLQLGGMFALWTWVTLLGVSFLLHYR